MKAIAFSNNDLALVAWAFDRKLPGCLGFQVERGDVNAGTWTGLPALARFEVDKDRDNLTTRDAPIQKFWWKDLGARRGGTFRYRITAMGGEPGSLQPLPDVPQLVSNPVTVTHDRGRFQAYFNRGFVSSQATINKLGSASVPRLLRHITDPNDPIRTMLCGELEDALLALLDRADDEQGGTIRGALYELSDPKGLEVRLQAKDHGEASSRAIVLGNSRISADKKHGKPEVADADSADRAALKAAGVHVVDRILPDQRIPHNKFLVLEENDQPAAVLTGSTNWTCTGLCTQTNNALIIESPAVAREYAAYWEELEKDTFNAASAGWQAEPLRDWCASHNEKMLGTPVALEDGSCTVQVLFSPNTHSLLSKSNAADAKDMEHVRQLMLGAKQAVLFLAFDPGNHSILDFAGETLKKNPKLFVRGALTSPQRAENFAEALHATTGETEGPEPEIGIVSSGETAKAVPDYRAIPAESVTKDDAFGKWHAEIHSAGHAIIHDKIVVIDPFDADCVVIAGSHNLGARASHNNDENFVIVTGHRPLAEAYACHVLDVYDHFAWRWWLKEKPQTFGKPLQATDTWQDSYVKGAQIKSPELAFWLGAVPSADVHETAPTRTRQPEPVEG